MNKFSSKIGIKILSILLLACMLTGMCASAFAEEQSAEEASAQTADETETPLDPCTMNTEPDEIATWMLMGCAFLDSDGSGDMYVYDEAGDVADFDCAYAGLTVSVYPPDVELPASEPLKEVEADDGGNYEFGELEQGDYLLAVELTPEEFENYYLAFAVLDEDLEPSTLLTGEIAAVTEADGTGNENIIAYIVYAAVAVGEMQEVDICLTGREVSQSADNIPQTVAENPEEAVAEESEIGSEGVELLADGEDEKYTSKDFEILWDDNGNVPGVRPDDVEIIIYADGAQITLQTENPDGENYLTKDKQSEADEWTYTVSKMQKYNSSGEEIVYTIWAATETLGYDCTVFSDYVTYAIKTVTISVTKAVSGTSAKKTDEFKFKITTPKSIGIYDTEDEEYCEFKDFELTAGKTEEFQLVEGVEFTVTETDLNGYILRYINGSAPDEGSTSSGGKAGTEGAVKYTFTNYKGKAPATGDDASLELYYMVAAISLAGIAIFWRKRLKTND